MDDADTRLPLLDARRPKVVAAEADDGVRAIVLTGAGRGFSSGADMNDLGALAKRKGERPPEDEGAVASGAPIKLAVLATLAGTAFFGVYPAPLINLARTAVGVLGS